MDRTDASLIAIRRILRAVEDYANELARVSGLTPVQVRVLQIVLARGSVTPKQIAAQMQVTPATISTLLDRLAAKAMVQRQRSETDKRQTNIVLTELGHRTIVDAPDPLQQKYVRQFESLADWEQSMIVAALERVASLLDAEGRDASPVLDTGDIQRSQPRIR